MWKLRLFLKQNQSAVQLPFRKSRSGVNVTNHPPLSKPLQGFENPSYIDSKSVDSFSSKLTTLPNGLRIASEPIFGEYCTVGVVINAGARYEAYYPPGICHFLEKLAFSHTLNYPNGEISSILEHSGALVDCQSIRDTFLYASSCHKKSVEQVLGIIADTVQRPIITLEDVQIGKEMVENENTQLARCPECEPLLTNWIHEAAFRGNTIGFSKYCKKEYADFITQQHLFSFLSQYYTLDRMVLAGIGIDHELLTDIGKSFFNSAETSWAKDPSLIFRHLPPIDDSVAQYSGGEIRMEKDLSKMALGPTPFPNLAHVVIGFEGVSLSDNDFVTFCVLQSLLGGGGSFSAGGPGKGMFSRLYVNVLHRYGWIYNTTAFNYSYADAGLFCIRASAPPEKLKEVPDIILKQFSSLVYKKTFDDIEIQRAKVQLKSQLLMNLEMRPVMFEDLGRQVLAHGRHKRAYEYLEAIDQIQISDIVRIGERMLNTKLSLVGYGNLSTLPSYDTIKSKI